MKHLLYFPFFLLLPVTPLHAQSVTDFVRLIDTQYRPYSEGEFWADDSFTDVRNGYYQRGKTFYAERPEDQKLLRQVAVFANNDGTKTIVETRSSYNFVCWDNEVLVYAYAEDSLVRADSVGRFLPALTDTDFLPAEIMAIFKKYYQRVDQSHYTNLEDFITQAYDRPRYVLPRYGTDITVHLDFCDYFGSDFEAEITKENYARIEHGTIAVKLAYDRELKRFVKRR